MVMDALRGYVQLANGLTEVTRQRAQQAAKALLQQTGADALTTKVTDLADEIVATSKSNRQLLQAIVANEVEGAVSRLGFVRSEEVGVLERRVDRLERELAVTRAAAEAAGSVAATAAGTAAAAAEKSEPLAKPAVKKSAAPVAKKPAVKKAAKKAPAKKA
ncbi:polyhydroxyalkanoate synthesis protein PhaF [Kribbella sp. ALI-6-A]|uniref:phasin family protein n=1 Tax=Kribbella sp. ALI-6-A TaxID=1933817 RepID=UPI00097CA07B|nr:phasin family protein [Kribbella sp. ALI-6-A]ONI71372.1 polyhydroxyalkanoate synthesis protein PhaF [Kribbella sp. ALI-6-A]